MLPVSSGGSITSHREWTGTDVESKYQPDISDRPEVKVGSTLSSHVAVTSMRQAARATANIHKPRRYVQKNLYLCRVITTNHKLALIQMDGVSINKQMLLC